MLGMIIPPRGMASRPHIHWCFRMEPGIQHGPKLCAQVIGDAGPLGRRSLLGGYFLCTVWAVSRGDAGREESMPRKRRTTTTKPTTPMLHCLQPNAAGVDVGATEIYISVPADRDPQSVRCFPTFTADLHAAA